MLHPLPFPEHPAPEKPAAPLPPLASEGSSNLEPEPEASRMQQLEAMLKEVQGRAEIIEKEAYDKAYLAGEKAGIALGKRRAEQMLAALESVLDQAERSLEEIRSGFAKAIVELAAGLAGRLLDQTLEEHPEWLVAAARNAAERLLEDATPPLALVVSEDDAEAFRKLLDTDELPARIRTDPELPQGRCLICARDRMARIAPAERLPMLIQALRAELDPASGHSE